MRSPVLLASATVLALGGCQTAARHRPAPGPTPAPAPAPDALINRPLAVGEKPWLKVPTGGQVAKLFPRKAKAAHIDGRVRIRCRVRPSGLLTNCAVLEETPKGYGFGGATLKFSKLLQLTPGPYGPATTLETPINWRAE